MRVRIFNRSFYFFSSSPHPLPQCSLFCSRSDVFPHKKSKFGTCLRLLHITGINQGRKKTRSDCPGQVNFALGQAKMEVWWPGGQVKLASAVLLVIIPVRNN